MDRSSAALLEVASLREFFGVLSSIGVLRARLGTPSAEYELASQISAF